MIEIVRGGSHISIWIWKLLITIDYYSLQQQRVQRFPRISIDWNSA